MNIVQVAEDLCYEVLEATNSDDAIAISYRARGFGLGLWWRHACVKGAPRNQPPFPRAVFLNL